MEYTTHFLDVDKINVFHGNMQVLWNLSVYVDKGEIVSMFGSNGAGKSTLVNTISGVRHPASGTISLDGKRIEQESPYTIVRSGLVQIPEGKRIFRKMSVLDNLKLGGYTQHATNDDLEYVFRFFPVLKERKKQLSGLLSGGEQQMLCIARALMAKPRILILDEITQGLAPRIVSQIFQALKDINRQNVTILLVEQNVRLALSVAQRVYVLENGTIRFSGSPEGLESSVLLQAYLGESGVRV